MSHDVTMPQLGMAQDTGIIIAWLKSPGDAVKVGDILMEVETDKATMEVEAAQGGFLAEIRAKTGVPIPVGDVIAVISEAAPAASAPQSMRGIEPEQASASAAVAPAPMAVTTDSTEPSPRQEPQTLIGHMNGRILASPKARYEAHRRGLDLTRLARQGVSQPFHVKDLEKMTAASVPDQDATELIEARVARAGFDEFAAWAAEASVGAVGKNSLWGSFISGAWRHAVSAGRPIVVALGAPLSGELIRRRDADLEGAAATAEPGDDVAPDLVVYDLTSSALTRYRPSAPSTSVLIISDAGENYVFSFSYSSKTLSPQAAASFLQGVAERAAVPLRNLL